MRDKEKTETPEHCSALGYGGTGYLTCSLGALGMKIIA